MDFPGFVGVTPAVGQTAQAHKLWSDVVVVAMLSLGFNFMNLLV